MPFEDSLKELRSIISEIEDELQGGSPDESTGGKAAAEPKEQPQPVSAPSKEPVAAKPEPKEPSNQAGQAPAKGQKKKKQAQPKHPAAKPADRDPFDEAALQVARIEVVERHPDADSLYVCQVALGQEARQLVTGLVKHYSQEELDKRLIVIIANLKATKLRGKESSAMLLAGDDSATTNQGLVKLLAPPPGASVGDRVYLEGQQPNEPAASLNHKQWGKVVPHFSVTGGKASYKGKALVTKDGPVTVPDLPDGSGIH